MAAQTGPEAGRQRDPDSLAAQRERESSAKDQLKGEAVDTLQSAQRTLDALSQAAEEGKQSVADLYKAGKEAVSAAVDRRLGDLGRWFDRKIGEVDSTATRAGRAVVAYGGAFVGGEGSGQRIVDAHAEGRREVSAIARETAEHALGIDALREELAATRRTLAEQAAAAGARATTEVVAAGVDAGVEHPEQKTVRSENGVNVRANASPTATKVDTLPKGAKVSLVPADPVDNDGYAWRKIAGPGNGWVASGPTNAPDQFLA